MGIGGGVARVFTPQAKKLTLQVMDGTWSWGLRGHHRYPKYPSQGLKMRFFDLPKAFLAF